MPTTLIPVERVGAQAAEALALVARMRVEAALLQSVVQPRVAMSAWAELPQPEGARLAQEAPQLEAL